MSYALLELHDVSLYYRREFLIALELLEEAGMYKFSLLVVPNFWERAPLGEDGELLYLIKSLSAEIILHGYTHRGFRRLQDLLWTDGEGEFGGLDLHETYQRLYWALELMDYVGLSSQFFVPPAWVGNPYLEDVLYSLGFKGVAYRWYIKDLKKGDLIRSPALTFSNRYFLSWFSIKLLPGLERLYSSQSLIRLALHMRDFRDERKIRLWGEVLKRFKNSRRWVDYGEIFSQSRPSSSFKGFQPTGSVV
ncbi:MAG: DUF2334 domain-containing protein [Aquificaceae bacterium]